MCGIAGQVRLDGEPVDRGLIERMCVRIQHRGPDDRGIHIDGSVGLGIQRLRVIDLETGDQPIYNEDRTIAVVLNGEIYNFAELRDELRARGHRLSTKGDTEVIVHLYEELGADCVDRLDGMFAFALWDGQKRRLLLARDRVGKKPLHYSLNGKRLSFASEPAALLEDRSIPRRPNLEAIDGYLALQYVPHPFSAFEGVSKLPPATTLVLEADGSCNIDRYWRLDYASERDVSDPKAVTAELRELIGKATAKRMVADVPVGAFLSGGIDSSAVVAAMADHSNEPVKTFSIGFEEEEFNELDYAREVATLFGTDHHELIVRPDALELLPKLVRHYGEPYADSSAIPTFYVSELARRHVTVALNGDGGDESFAGYNRYVSQIASHRLRRLPGWTKRAGALMLAALPGRAQPRSFRNRARRLLAHSVLDGPDRYALHMAFFDADLRAGLSTPEFAAAAGAGRAAGVIHDAWAGANGSNPIDVMLETDIETYLPGDLLVKVDIASMAHSLEARSPLLDRAVMEFAASLPARCKVDGLEKKVGLRQALRGQIPDRILDRPKMGFGVPLDHWFRGPLESFAREVLDDPRTHDRGYFQPSVVRSLIDDHVAARVDNSSRIWALLMLEIWHRELIDQS